MLWGKFTRHLKSFTWNARYLLLSTLFVIIPTTHSSPSDWLLKIGAASSQLSFSGQFVYIRDNNIETVSVTRRIQDGFMEERLRSLDGVSREVIRDRDRIWCYFPEKELVVHDYRHVVDAKFPHFLLEEMEQITSNYTLVKGVETRIADRAVQEIQIIPKDQFRYGYKLWADKSTGLLLRSDLIDIEGNVFEQYFFINIDIGNRIADSELKPSDEHRNYKQLSAQSPPAAAAASNKWTVTDLPSGFSLLNHVHRTSPMNNRPVEHLVYSDGLSSVSVFIKKHEPGRENNYELSTMGSVHAFQRVVDGYQISVFGEVPAATVQHLAMGVMPIAEEG